MAPIISVSDEDYRALKQLGFRHQLVETPKKADLVVPVSDFWEVPNVYYRGKTLIADLSNKLLPVRTQQQHAEHRNSAGEGEFVTMDMPFYIAMFDALFEQKDDLAYAGQARDFIKGAMRSNFPNTLTRIVYSSRGKDRVTHNYGTKDSYQTKTNVVGEDRIIQRGDRQATSAVLGTRNISRLHQVFNWINGTDLSIYRLNEKPQKLTECVARLYASPGGAWVGCDWHPDYAYASLGVRVHARSASKK